MLRDFEFSKASQKILVGISDIFHGFLLNDFYKNFHGYINIFIKNSSSENPKLLKFWFSRILLEISQEMFQGIPLSIPPEIPHKNVIPSGFFYTFLQGTHPEISPGIPPMISTGVLMKTSSEISALMPFGIPSKIQNIFQDFVWNSCWNFSRDTFSRITSRKISRDFPRTSS